MDKSISFIAVAALLSGGLATSANADDQLRRPAQQAEVAEGGPPNDDCSQQVWPHISPSCLKNAPKVEVRLIATTRR